jgi:nuclear transport factor 2 (NTF2) superfamily protein
VNPTIEAARAPLPPFTRETALQKVRLAEDAWNSRDPKRVSLAHTPDSRWRNRSKFRWPQGRRPEGHASLSDLGL